MNRQDRNLCTIMLVGAWGFSVAALGFAAMYVVSLLPGEPSPWVVASLGPQFADPGTPLWRGITAGAMSLVLLLIRRLTELQARVAAIEVATQDVVDEVGQ